jgi:hypothetical protein
LKIIDLNYNDKQDYDNSEKNSKIEKDPPEKKKKKVHFSIVGRPVKDNIFYCANWEKGTCKMSSPKKQ